jgi:hypothetical protein
MIFGIANDGNSNTEPRSGSAFWHCFRRVVGSLGVNVRAEIFKQGFYTRFAKEDHVVDGAKRGDEQRTRILIENGTAGTFQRADARVRVDTDDEDIAFASRALQVPDVPYMKRIETAVGKNDALPPLLVFR